VNWLIGGCFGQFYRIFLFKEELQTGHFCPFEPAGNVLPQEGHEREKAIVLPISPRIADSKGISRIFAKFWML